MKDRESVTENGRAAFYACMWEDLRNAALDRGWAFALHGSLKSDMDIMGMPWTESAAPIEDLLKAIAALFAGSIWIEQFMKPHFDKPHGRVVYTLSIWADFYIDLSVMDPRIICDGEDT